MAVHARNDYNTRFQDRALKKPELLAPGTTAVAEDEPIFVLRAKDVLFVPMLQNYAMRCRAAGLFDVARNVEGHIGVALKWQNTNGTKFPDFPKKV